MGHVSAARHLWVVDDVPMSDLMTGFESYLRANNCGDSTVHDRLKHVADFQRCHPAHPNVGAADIITWLGRPGYAQWSRATYFGHLRSYFHYAKVTGLLERDPMAGMTRPRPGNCVPRPLTSAQVAVVMAAANPTVHAWLTLGLYAGLRAFEIAKIRAEDVSQDSIYVLGKGGRAAYVPTHPLVWELAQSRPSTGFWFPSSRASLGGHVGSVWVTTATTRVFAAQGVEGSIHRMRHTFATRLLRSGVNVRVLQSLMRHASLNSTMIYCLVDEDERRDAIALLMAA